MRTQSIIAEIVTKRGYVGAIVANPSGSILFQVGDLNRLEWKGLLSLFGDAEAIRNLGRFLEGQTTPRLQKQGQVQCTLLRPQEDLIIGLFDQSGRATIDVFAEAEQVLNEIRSSLSSPPLDERSGAQ